MIEIGPNLAALLYSIGTDLCFIIGVLAGAYVYRSTRK